MIKLLLLALKAGKLGKFALTGGTMVLSVIAYAWMFGWLYAVGFVALILVHELGHYFAARNKGLNVGAPTFVPFVGAWIELKDLPRDAETEAYIGVAGPLAGTLGALACFYLAREFDSRLLLALAYSGFFLNLFNLIPIAPFDGGRITAVISPMLWLVGVPVLIAMFIYRPSPLLVLMGVLAAPQAWKAWKAMRGQLTLDEQQYYVASTDARLSYGTLYVGLICFLALMCQSLHEELPPAF